MIDPAEFARRTAERGATKQLEVSAFDRDVVQACRGAASASAWRSCTHR